MFKIKLKEWLKRYLLADTLSTIFSLFVAWAVKVTADDRVLAAFLASAVASIVFYGVITIRDVRISIRQHRIKNKKYKMKSFIKDFRNLLVEFGPAELLDVFAVRPFFMYLIPTLMTNFLIGSFIGKTIADIIFFVPAILMYEVRKKHLK
ncbi:MAG: hypothetical protein Q8O72_08420 [Bacteroidales bacterium]|jgi:hypothetical protein|nr:hypothetical protein [Bacteroidales bacterium]